MRAACFVLLYGPHTDLHRRLLLGQAAPGKPRYYGLFETLPQDVRPWIWLNQVGPKTMADLQFSGAFRDRINLCWIDGENVPKYKVMRKLFERAGVYNPGSGIDWVIWHDDDNAIVRADWFDLARRKIEADQSIGLLGPSWIGGLSPQQEAWAKTRPWHRGRPFGQIACPYGAYWWMRADLLREIDWPDRELSHNSADNPHGLGGDTVLGFAADQARFKTVDLKDCGVKIGVDRRRGIGAK